MGKREIQKREARRRPRPRQVATDLVPSNFKVLGAQSEAEETQTTRPKAPDTQARTNTTPTRPEEGQEKAREAPRKHRGGIENGSIMILPFCPAKKKPKESQEKAKGNQRRPGESQGEPKRNQKKDRRRQRD